MLRIISAKCVLPYELSRHAQFRRASSFFFNVPKKEPEPVLDEAYVPSKVESDNSFNWSYFKPTIISPTPYTMIMPPPNVTGYLHLGHALTATIQDVIARWKTMQGIETVWVPGYDHAGIAAQVVVEKCLKKQLDMDRHMLGRNIFNMVMQHWMEDRIEEMDHQLWSLNLILAWDREYRTNDFSRERGVIEAFVRLFEWGLIYRADRLVNWSCSMNSAISDIEVDHLEVEGPTRIPVPGYENTVEFGVLTHFAYKFVDSDEEIIVATTRPETILGDVALAVNPKDDRYARHIGRYVWHPFRRQAIPVICDDSVDPGFGTGVVKVTPAHDQTDFEIGQRHSLPSMKIIDENGLITEECGEEFAGKPRFVVRDEILSRLVQLNLLRTKQPHQMSVPICSRSRDVVELLLKPQWFLKCQEMAKRAVKDVKEGRLSIEPKHFEKNWFAWLENIRDWNLSRQIWWGHGIPAYDCYLEDEPEKRVWVAARSQIEARCKAAGKLSTYRVEKVIAERDPDVLDTWFSSGLTPFLAFYWESKISDVDRYYPLDLMETAHDILFFWVARMVMLGTTLTGQLPFPKILLHGVICDSDGRKMSKSLGNVIAPSDVIRGRTLEQLEEFCKKNQEFGILTEEETERAIQCHKKMFPEGIPACGPDALRFTLLSHNIQNHFIQFDVQECLTNKLFCNKIWQAARFTNIWMEKVSQHQSLETATNVTLDKLTPMDRWILSRLSEMVQVCRRTLDSYDFHVTTAALKNFFYYEFCDVYLESTKRGLRTADSPTALGHCWTLTTCLHTALRALAPFMPALSRHIYERLRLYPGMERTLYYPEELEWRDEILEKQISTVMETVIAIRRLKKIFGVAAKHKPQVHILSDTPIYEGFDTLIQDLSACHRVNLNLSDSNDSGDVTSQRQDPSRINKNKCVSDRVSQHTRIYLEVPEELRQTIELDLPKLQAKKGKLIKELDKMNRMMSGSGYKEKATAVAQETHAKKIAQLQDKLARIDYLQNFSK